MRSGHRGLPGAGVAGEAHVQAGRLRLQAEVHAQLVITSSAAMSRMRALDRCKPTRSRSSSSITAPAWLCASTSFTVCASVDCGAWAGAAPVGARARARRRRERVQR